MYLIIVIQNPVWDSRVGHQSINTTVDIYGLVLADAVAADVFERAVMPEETRDEIKTMGKVSE